ncbi:uncharacterized protein with a C-terminal OMP [Zymobacter palmae]|uniref:Uncharacterized protein with a C-terminal OMP n=1 Tax=Zymobacter palmae TaxID=33074 RepID=A0A348HGH1_9GAMM|nr:uncharacterized protein with a C-terminal OMP [Zymobacter palmae]
MHCTGHRAPPEQVARTPDDDTPAQAWRSARPTARACRAAPEWFRKRRHRRPSRDHRTESFPSGHPSSDLAEDQRTVGTAETERVAHGVVDLHLARRVRHVIQTAVFARIVEVDSRRSNLITDSQNAKGRFHGTGSTQQVTDHGFSGADGNVLRSVAHDVFNRLAFTGVTQLGRCTVRVDIVDLVCSDAGIGDGILHRHLCTNTVRCRDVMSVVAHTEARQLGIDLRTARLGMFVLFKHQYAGTVGQDETITVAVPRTASCSRIIVTRGQRTCSREAADPERAGRHFSTATDHDVSIAVSDRACGVADVVRTGCAGRGDRKVRASEAEFDRQVAGHHVDDGTRNEERRDLARAASVHGIQVGFDHRQTTDTGTDGHTDAVSIFFGDFNASIGDGLSTCRNAVLDEQIHLAGALAINAKAFGIEILDRTAEARIELRGIEMSDGTYTALARRNVFPRFFDGVTHRCYQPKTGNNDPSARHATLQSNWGYTA